jgi:hypothetical protein
VSPSLILLSGLIMALGAVPLLMPRKMFEFPYVVGMFLSVWLLPQAWAVESGGLADPFDPTIAWGYMTLAIVFLVSGYFGGRLVGKQAAEKKQAEIATMYSEKRMAQASMVLIAIGAGGFFMMGRTAAVTTYEAGWTGIIIVYAMLAQCLVFGAALNFIIYLRTKSRISLVLFLIATAIFSPGLLVAVKREFIFEFAIIIFGSLFLVRNFVMSRFFLLAGCLIGAFIVNQAGMLRGYVKNNDSSLVGALTSSEVLSGEYGKGMQNVPAPEVTGAVTDIAIATDIGGYRPGVSLYNGMVSRYFPAVIFGREAKNALMIKTSDSPLSNRYFANGATRTGFSDTFLDYWYFGVFAFAILGGIFGWLFSMASVGGLRDQYLYVSLLGTGLHGITHAFQEFVCALPFLLLVVWLPFRYARITIAESKRLALTPQLQGGS